jgi:hypothetical protein
MVKCSKAEVRRLKTALYWKGDPEQRQRIQMVLLRENGMTQPAIAEAMGVSLSTVNRAHMAYDHGGLKALRRKPIGGRKRENMTLDEGFHETDQFSTTIVPVLPPTIRGSGRGGGIGHVIRIKETLV